MVSINVPSSKNKLSISTGTTGKQASVSIENVQSFAINKAKDWAEKMDGPIGNEGYSAKYHSTQAAISAASADSSATEAEETKNTAIEEMANIKQSLLTNSDFVAVRNSLDEITIVSENLGPIEATGLNIEAIKTTAGNKANIDTVVANLPNIEATIDNLQDIQTVTTNINAVKTTSSNINNVNTTANNIGTIQTAVTNLTTINTVSSSLTPIKNTANNITAINNVNTNIEAVKSNYTNISDIKANATNMADIKDTAKLVTTLDNKVDIDDMVEVDMVDISEAGQYITSLVMPDYSAGVNKVVDTPYTEEVDGFLVVNLLGTAKTNSLGIGGYQFTLTTQSQYAHGVNATFLIPAGTSYRYTGATPNQYVFFPLKGDN